MRQACLSMVLTLALLSPAMAEDHFDQAKRRLDGISKRIETWLAAKQKADCEVPDACDYAGKFRNAQTAWRSWVEAEFAYENYELGGAGSVVSNAMEAYLAQQMTVRAGKLERDFEVMKKSR